MTSSAAVSDPLTDLWDHMMSRNRTHLFCFYPSKITMSGIWTGDNPLDFSLPLLLFQILLITFTTRAATLLLSPLRLPRYISEILGGFVLGPSVLGRLPHFSDIVFPMRSIFVLDSMALLGLIYYTFTIGVEIELPTITRAGYRSFWFAGASAVPPFLIGATVGYIALSTDDTRKQKDSFLNALSFPILLGATFSSTAFSVLARNIAELKLAGTDVGQLTLSASLINDTLAWSGLTIATALSDIMSDQSFTVLVFMSALITALVSPLLSMVVKPARRLVFYKRRTVAWAQPDAELRVLACVNVPRDAPAAIALIDILSPSSRSPVAVHALHLIEFAGRASALLLINASAPAASAHGRSHVEMQFKHIAHAFLAYEENHVAGGVSVRTMAAVSPYVSMHEDVTAAAEDQHSALIMLPFHKYQTVDGGMEVSHPAIQELNVNVQSCSPCTVGILVDRGLSIPAGGTGGVYRVAALFFGGRDDREVVALATRMARNRAVDLTVLRFVQKGRAGSYTASEFDALKERKADDGCFREFLDRASVAGGAGVEYCERGVFNANEMVAEIRNVDAAGKDLFVVGKTPGGAGLTAGMADWSECPELGPIGDLLASKDFQTTASVLVVQSYGRASASAVGPTASSEFAVGEALVVQPAETSMRQAGQPPRRPRQQADLTIG
uniref:Uncharacterized protein n=1 Tax=Avena sativa TaxID=4498 RepID=A0ACD5XPQ8_AVESA